MVIVWTMEPMFCHAVLHFDDLVTMYYRTELLEERLANIVVIVVLSKISVKSQGC